MKIIQKYKERFKRETIEKVSIFFSVILYFGISFIILRNLVFDKQTINNTLFLQENAVNGVMSQLQMFLLVYLSLRERKSGYVTALLLNSYGIIILLWLSFMTKDDNAFHGVASCLGIYFIITLVNRYKKSVREQKEMLLLQYDKLRVKEKKLKKMAFFDDLTGVFNRRIFLEEINLQVEFSSKTYKNFYVVFIDIDNFKGINDTLGHHVGDIVLQEIVSRMKVIIHEEDVIGRLGGDEFGILINRKMGKEDVLHALRQMRILLEEPFIVEGNEIRTSASFGIAEYPQNGVNATELMKNSDKAMYSAKESGKNQIFFSE